MHKGKKRGQEGMKDGPRSGKTLRISLLTSPSFEFDGCGWEKSRLSYSKLGCEKY
jgi:hypothetical protein